MRITEQLIAVQNAALCHPSAPVSWSTFSGVGLYFALVPRSNRRNGLPPHEYRFSRATNDGRWCAGDRCRARSPVMRWRTDAQLPCKHRAPKTDRRGLTTGVLTGVLPRLTPDHQGFTPIPQQRSDSYPRRRAALATNRPTRWVTVRQLQRRRVESTEGCYRPIQAPPRAYRQERHVLVPRWSFQPRGDPV